MCITDSKCSAHVFDVETLMSSDVDEGENKEVLKHTWNSFWNRWKLASLYMEVQRNLKTWYSAPLKTVDTTTEHMWNKSRH
jgi:hypothetical protein